MDEIEVNDTLRFFTGDHPTTQFEQGTKQGGTYKCGMCGCKESMFDDQAHSLHKWRSLKQLKSLATGGSFGKRAGVLRPFNLKVADLRAELKARGIAFDTKALRTDLQKCLENTLLLTDTTQPLSSLHLQMYEIVGCEPLHDIKGHLLVELPHILPPGNTTTKCTHLIENCLSKEKKSGADLRRAVIQVYLLSLVARKFCSSSSQSSKLGRSLTHVMLEGPHDSYSSSTTCAGSTWSCVGIFSANL